MLEFSSEILPTFRTNVENFHVLKIGLNLFEISKQVLKGVSSKPSGKLIVAPIFCFLS
jgi:hypothetical protein